MKAIGIVKRFDDDGRIAVPKEVRRQALGKIQTEGMPMEFFYEDDGTIIMKPYIPKEEEKEDAESGEMEQE